MKKLFEEQDKTLYEIQKDLGYSVNRLYRIANGEVNVNKVGIKLILDLAWYFKVTPSEIVGKIEEYQRRKNG